MKYSTHIFFLGIAMALMWGIGGHAQDRNGVVHSELKPKIYWDTAASEKAGEDEKKLMEKRKWKRREFYGRKTKKQYTKKPFRGGAEVELFYVLKEWEDPDPYVEDIYWFDTRTARLREGRLRKRDKPYAQILHGPYERIRNGFLVEEGQFFFGTKHGRWMLYSGDEDMELVRKDKYYKGYYRESLISYLTPEREKVKEVVPIKNGRKHGRYLKYYENGQLAVKGDYDFGQRVGLWYYYYKTEDGRKHRKKVERYPPNFHVRKKNKYEPHVVVEYNKEGDVTYEYDDARRKEDIPIKRPEVYNPEWYAEEDEEDD